MTSRVVISVLVFLSSCAWINFGLAAADAPQFRDYSVNVYSGPVRSPDLSSHPDAKTYRSRLRTAAKGDINFAREYILATWGCGGQCLMGAVISARTGRVQFLPGTICCWFEAGEDINPIDYQADSTLIVLTGLINEEEPLARYYYEIEGGEFRLIQSQAIAAGKPDPGPDTSGRADGEPQTRCDARGNLKRGEACLVSNDACCRGLRCQELSPDLGGGWECQPGSGP